MKQFVSGEDDLFDTLNQSLARDGIGQTDLDDQLEFGTGQQLDGHFDENDGQRRTKEYVFGESSQPLVDPSSSRAALPNRFSTFSPASAWAEANRLLGSGGSLQDATQLLEAFIQRASMEDYQQLQVTDVEAWSLLGRTHAMNEKEEKALSALEEGRRTLEGEDAGREKVAGEMLTVSRRTRRVRKLMVDLRTSRSPTSTSRKTSLLSPSFTNSSVSYIPPMPRPHHKRHFPQLQHLLG